MNAHVGRPTAARSFALGVALALSLPGSSEARDGLRTGSIAAIATVPDRNIADVKPDASRERSPERGELAVIVDRAKVIRLPERTQTVIVGNPAIADITLQKAGVVVLTGKSFGVTNFIALDATGSILAESMVSVAAPTDATLVVQRGFDRQTYSCTPRCQPSVVLGDSNSYFADVKGQADAHGQFAGQR